MGKPKVPPFYIPPTLVLRQLGSLLYYGYLVRWGKTFHWLFGSGFKTLPVASGAYCMGCIGFPAHPVWEVTLACNLRCIHCHASSGTPSPDELTTEEGFRLLDELAKVREFRMLVITGGEPLVRKDIFDLLAHGKELGFSYVIATNATLITEETAFRLKENGVSGVAVSLDAPVSSIHNMIRNHERAFELAIRGIKNAKRAGLVIQVNFTAMDYNLHTLEGTIDLVNDIGADIMLVYQLVPVGRGRNIRDASLGRERNKRLYEIITRKQRDSRTIVKPVAMPQYWSYMIKSNGDNGLLRGIGKAFFHGCTAGRGLVYIKANGDVWPCPFVEVRAGNVREEPFTKIWREAEVFKNLRNRKETLKGKCGTCKFNEICGGCRGRALALTGDYLGEDPYCFLER